MKQLKIGITCYPTFGGSGVIATEIGMAMAARGHRVHFICLDVPKRLNQFRENIFFHEVEVNDYPLFSHSPYSLALSSKMVEVATYEELDIFHVHYAVPHAASAYMAKQILGKKSPKVITTLHGTDITLVGNDRSYLPITRFSIIESDGLTTPSNYLRQATYDKLNIPTTVPIEVIPNFVDTDKFCPPSAAEKPEAMKRICGSPCPEMKFLVHVSNFRPVKRLPDVVEVFARVQEKMKAHLILIGDGPERSRTESRVRELGLSSAVSFLGKQESFIEILQHSDLFLLPSENESFGLAALEALSCGVPVVASRIAGIPEVVQHEESGFLSEVGDVADMATHALDLLSDKAKYQRFSSTARRMVLENFGQEQLMDRYEAYYQQILG